MCTCSIREREEKKEKKIKPLTSFLIGPVDEEVHGADLCDLLVASVQPQHLLTALLHRLALDGYGRPIVTETHTHTHTMKMTNCMLKSLFNLSDQT